MNLKKWKEGLFFIPAAVLAVSALSGLQKNIPVFPEIPEITPVENAAAKEVKRPSRENLPIPTQKEPDSKKKSASKKKVSYKKKSAWKDGTYIGKGTGYGGTISVQVVIKKGKISDVKILSHTQETPEYFSMAQVLSGRILKAQTPNVDEVSGATYSSRGIIEAAADALVQAGDKKITVKKNTPEKNEIKKDTAKKEKSENTPKKPKQKVTADGQPADGVYEGSAVCERFGYTIHLKVRLKDGKVTAVYGLEITGNSNPENAVFWNMAWKPVVKDLLEKQSVPVDAVSGATYSSNAIMDAFAEAYNKAVSKNAPEEENKKAVSTPEPTETPVPAETPIPTETPAPTEAPVPMETEVPTGTEMPNGSSVSGPEADEPDADATALLYKDGIYPVSVMVYPDEEEDFYAYELRADAVAADGKFTGFENIFVEDSVNLWYCNRALEGTGAGSGILEQLLEKKDATLVDMVSGATCSSNAWIRMFQEFDRLASEE